MKKNKARDRKDSDSPIPIYHLSLPLLKLTEQTIETLKILAMIKAKSKGIAPTIKPSSSPIPGSATPAMFEGMREAVSL